MVFYYSNLSEKKVCQYTVNWIDSFHKFLINLKNHKNFNSLKKKNRILSSC